MFNPESYSLAYQNEFSKPQGINSSGKGIKYILSKPANLSLKIIIDGTGASEIGISPIVGLLPGTCKKIPPIRLLIIFPKKAGMYIPGYRSFLQKPPTWTEISMNQKL